MRHPKYPGLKEGVGFPDPQKKMIAMAQQSWTPKTKTATSEQLVPQDIGICYILWALLGLVGGHRFYLNRKNTAIAQLILTLTLFGVVVTLVWMIVDAFLIPRMFREETGLIPRERPETSSPPPWSGEAP
jgi:hypothetical protein